MVRLGRGPMPELPKLHRLRAEYGVLAEQSLAGLDPDARESLRYFLLDVDPEAAGETRPGQWVVTLRRVEAFIGARGRLPAENNRRPNTEERSLSRWLQRQRRAHRHGLLVEYQRRRLECVPGFTFDPAQDAWNVARDEYARFTTTFRRAPAARSQDPGERKLARWADKQRWRFRRGVLPRHRQRALESLPIWAWGDKSRRP